MKRTLTTDFEFGDVETTLEITPEKGKKDLSPAKISGLHGSITAHLMQHTLPTIAGSINSFELTPGEIETTVRTPASLSTAGYNCKLVVTLVLSVKIEASYVSAIVALLTSAYFSEIVSQAVGRHAATEMLKTSPYYELLTQKLAEENPLASLLMPPKDDTFNVGQYL